MDLRPNAYTHTGGHTHDQRELKVGLALNDHLFPAAPGSDLEIPVS